MVCCDSLVNEIFSLQNRELSLQYVGLCTQRDADQLLPIFVNDRKRGM